MIPVLQLSLLLRTGIYCKPASQSQLPVSTFKIKPKQNFCSILSFFSEPIPKACFIYVWYQFFLRGGVNKAHSCGNNIQKFTFNTMRPRRNGRHFPDDIFEWIFLNENVWISINISLKFVPRCPINNIPTLVQVMAWCRPGAEPLSKPMMVRLPTHICVTQPQWVKNTSMLKNEVLYLID